MEIYSRAFRRPGQLKALGPVTNFSGLSGTGFRNRQFLPSSETCFTYCPKTPNKLRSETVGKRSFWQWGAHHNLLEAVYK